jgi:hypothetical protein
VGLREMGILLLGMRGLGSIDEKETSIFQLVLEQKSIRGLKLVCFL